MSKKLSKNVESVVTDEQATAVNEEVTMATVQETAVDGQATTVNEQAVVADETLATVDEQSVTNDEDKLTFKKFFAKIGAAIRNYFVSLGKRIANFFVNVWHKTVKFFKNVGVFFKMLFTSKKKSKTDVDVEAVEVEEANGEATPVVDAEVVPADAEVIHAEVDAIADEEAPVDEVEAMRSRVKYFFRKRNKDEWKTFLLGNNEQKGFIQKFVSYALLILFGFVYAYPILYMLGYSLMGESDVLNPMVNYLPTEWQWSNYREAAQTLNFFNTLLQTAYISVLPSLFQTVACGITAYGLARFRFPGKNVLFGLILLTFIIPPQLTMMPQLIIFTNLGFAGNVLSFMIPAALGQGIKSAVFILIFYQFFKGIPDSVVEAAKIDGANSIQIFLRIGIPAAMPAILLSFLLSVVWYYNETVLSAVYLGNSVKMLPMELEKFQSTYQQLFPSSTTGKSVNEAIYMAGTLLNILPLIILYFFTQRHFVDGIDKAGITGE